MTYPDEERQFEVQRLLRVLLHELAVVALHREGEDRSQDADEIGDQWAADPR